MLPCAWRFIFFFYLWMFVCIIRDETISIRQHALSVACFSFYFFIFLPPTRLCGFPGWWWKSTHSRAHAQNNHAHRDCHSGKVDFNIHLYIYIVGWQQDTRSMREQEPTTTKKNNRAKAHHFTHCLPGWILRVVVGLFIEMKTPNHFSFALHLKTRRFRVHVPCCLILSS